MIDNRISKLGREQVESAKEIIICKSNPYFMAKFGSNTPKFEPDYYIALAIFKNELKQLVYAGDFKTWQFYNLTNAMRAIKRINKEVPIKIYSDDDIAKFVALEQAEMAAFVEAAKQLNDGNKANLINLLSEKK